MSNEQQMSSPVDTSANPSHYDKHKIHPYMLIREYDLNFATGNVIKYVARHKEKNGRTDLVKGLWNLLEELGMPKDQIVALTKVIEAADWSMIKIDPREEGRRP